MSAAPVSLEDTPETISETWLMLAIKERREMAWKLLREAERHEQALRLLRRGRKVKFNGKQLPVRVISKDDTLKPKLSRHRAQVARIIEIVCGLPGSASAVAVLGSGRQQGAFMTRARIAWLIRHVIALSYPEIGQAFSRHWSTIIHECHHIEQLMASREAFGEQMRALKRKIEEELARGKDSDGEIVGNVAV